MFQKNWKDTDSWSKADWEAGQRFGRPD